MKVLIAVLILSATGLFGQAFPKLDQLVTKTKKTFKNVTITQKREDGISIMHDAGTARIKFEDLPDDLAEKLGGFDPGRALIARVEEDSKEAATFAEIEAGIPTATPTESNNVPLVPPKVAVVRILKSRKDGSICAISWDSVDRLISGRKFEPGRHFVSGILGAADGQEFSVMIAQIGVYSSEGATIKSWRLVGNIRKTFK